MSGSALIGVSSVSEILDQFFQKRERAGRPAPAWKKEAQAMISLVQSLKDINETTQATVDGYVHNIIDTLKGDVKITQDEQDGAKTTLDGFKSTTVTELGHLSTQLTKVKSLSGTSKGCRANWTALKTSFYSQCSDNDKDGDAPWAGLEFPSLMEVGAGCPKECGKPSKQDFELNADAKKSYTCDFEAGETAKQCVARLWAKVNMTRQNLTNHYNQWSADKKRCEDHMARCSVCQPLWDNMVSVFYQCNDKRDVLYDAYCTLQSEQNDFCTSNETLQTQWYSALSPAQDARVSEYSDLEFIICIFEKYLETKTFTKEMIDQCTHKTAADFYGSTTVGELTLPTYDASAVPACYGAVSHSSATPLFDLTGLINELKIDKLAQTISVDSHAYAPAAGPGSSFCTVLTAR